MPTHKLRRGDRSLPVLSIKLVLSDYGYENGRSLNHATIYLVTPDQTSVRLNMMFGLEDIGVLEIRRCDYDHPRNASSYYFLAAAEGLTVGKVVSFIRMKKRDQYEFNEYGVGCRFWW